MGSTWDLGARHVVSELKVKLTSWVGMAPKKNRKQPQDSMVEEPVEDRVAPLESIGEEEPKPRDDQDEPKSEEEQRSSVLFTQEQLEVLLKMGRPDFGELVAVLKTGAAKGERFQPAKPGNFDGAHDRKVMDAWLTKMDNYIHAAKVGRHSAMELAQSYLKGYAATWWRTVKLEEGKNNGYMWEFFKERIELEFIPRNSDYISRCKLRDLVNATNENLRQYVRAYSEFMLEIRHMHELDRVCQFVMGLPTWAKRKLEESWPASLSEAITKVENFSDVGRSDKFGFKKDNKFFHKKPRHEGEWNRGQGSPTKEKPKQFQGSGSKPKGNFVKKGVPFKGSQTKGDFGAKPKGTCFNCNEVGHYSKDCPKSKTGVGSSKVLALNANLAQLERDRLIFLKGKIAKWDILCLLDTGDSHNFITRESAERMELHLEELKAPIEVHFVDGVPHPTTSQTKGVPLQLENWRGKVDLMVSTLGGMDCILGMEFITQNNVLIEWVVTLLPMTCFCWWCTIGHGGRISCISCIDSRDRSTKLCAIMSSISTPFTIDGIRIYPGSLEISFSSIVIMGPASLLIYESAASISNTSSSLLAIMVRALVFRNCSCKSGNCTLIA